MNMTAPMKRVTIITRDMDKALAFCRDLLGFDIFYEGDVGGDGVSTLMGVRCKKIRMKIDAPDKTATTSPKRPKYSKVPIAGRECPSKDRSKSLFAAQMLEPGIRFPWLRYRRAPRQTQMPCSSCSRSVRRTGSARLTKERRCR